MHCVSVKPPEFNSYTGQDKLTLTPVEVGY